jgi:hypothetical protein
MYDFGCKMAKRLQGFFISNACFQALILFPNRCCQGLVGVWRRGDSHITQTCYEGKRRLQCPLQCKTLIFCLGARVVFCRSCVSFLV